MGHRLHEEFPYLEAEVRYAVREYACTAVDVIARRLRLAFLNTYAAHQVLDQVVGIMGTELGWSSAECRRQLDVARQFINTEMGQEARAQSMNEITLNLTHDEVQAAKQRFNMLDKERKGLILLNHSVYNQFRSHHCQRHPQAFSSKLF